MDRLRVSVLSILDVVSAVQCVNLSPRYILKRPYRSFVCALLVSDRRVAQA